MSERAWTTPRGVVLAPGPSAVRFYTAQSYLCDSETYFDLAAITAAVAEVVSDRAVRQLAPWLAPTVEVRLSTRMAYAGRADRAAGRITFGEGHDIVSQTLVLHELAHLVAPTYGHGPAFARVFDTLLGRFAQWHGRPTTGWHAENPYGVGQQVRLRVGMLRGGLRFPEGSPCVPELFSDLVSSQMSDPEVFDAIDDRLLQWTDRRIDG